MHKLRFLSQTLAPALLLAACSADAPVTYAGDLAPQDGTCDPPARATLIKRGRDVDFTPSQGVLILTGEIAPSGAVTAHLQTLSADHKPYTLKLTATLEGAAITGAYVTPRCRYAVHLTRSP